MAKVKILQFPIANSFGGITHYALDNWKWMNKDKFQCDFATMSKKLDFADDILATGSKIHYISCYAEENRKKFIEEFNAILDEGYDVVHLHTKQWKSFLVEELCKEKGVKKIIVHAHSTGIDTLDEVKREFEIQLHEQVKKEFSEEMATDFWACSKLAANFLFGEQIPREKIKIMPNAIELEKFQYDEKARDEIRKKYNLENCFVIGHVGRFVYPKNHEFMIQVFSQVEKQIDNARLVLLGDGELLQEMKELAASLKIEDKVLFLGKRNDVNKWYSAMDVFCLPSRFEGFPISMIEASASGLHCIGSDSITSEVKEIDFVELLPCERLIWVESILNKSKKERIDNRKCLSEKGFIIGEQIKRIEAVFCK